MHCKKPTVLLASFVTLLAAFSVHGAEPIRPISRRIPPIGIEVPEKTRSDLQHRLDDLQQRISQSRHPSIADVEIFTKAVDLALRHNEFYSAKDFATAAEALDAADRRLKSLSDDKTPWAAKRGLVVRGYRSAIDGSPQPYGLEIPADLPGDRPSPLFVWLHGRGDKTTDLHFIAQRQTRPGKISPDGTIILHPFGRQCIGFKSAGEIDVLEAITHACSQYNIDQNRIVLMGFSMGGAGCWHIGAHYADRWVAISPGAGFAETARYTRLAKTDYPPWYEQRLWGMYDVPCYVRNLFNLPVVAYSGEIDKQIQAARVMEEAFVAEGRKLRHEIGPGMGHKYHPDSLSRILAEMNSAASKGRDRWPQRVSFQTQTLRYNKLHWVEVLGLAEHWRDSRVDARRDGDQLSARTKNISTVRFHVQPDRPLKRVRIDDDEFEVGAGKWHQFTRDETGWKTDVSRTANGMLKKSPGLQGPIDDAFMGPFLVVVPSGESTNPQVARWVDFELAHFRARWRSLFRGELRTKKDVDVTAEDAQKFHLVLWGDPQSNSVLKDLLGDLPIQWNETDLTVAGTTYDSAQHVPILVYPHPDGTGNYVVINGQPTFRESHDRTNSLQNPKLPDWAVIDLSRPPDDVLPGRVAAADFFDETWSTTTSQQKNAP